MQKDAVNMKRRRLNDYPELQVGFPERNDVSAPDEEPVRRDGDHAELDTSGRDRKRPATIDEGIRRTGVSRA